MRLSLCPHQPHSVRDTSPAHHWLSCTPSHSSALYWGTAGGGRPSLQWWRSCQPTVWSVPEGDGGGVPDVGDGVQQSQGALWCTTEYRRGFFSWEQPALLCKCSYLCSLVFPGRQSEWQCHPAAGWDHRHSAGGCTRFQFSHYWNYPYAVRDQRLKQPYTVAQPADNNVNTVHIDWQSCVYTVIAAGRLPTFNHLVYSYPEYNKITLSRELPEISLSLQYKLFYLFCYVNMYNLLVWLRFHTTKLILHVLFHHQPLLYCNVRTINSDWINWVKVYSYHGYVWVYATLLFACSHTTLGAT